MAIFGPKPWVNPFRKMSSFRLFEFLIFIVQKGIFFILEYRKRYFPGLYCIRRKVGKISIFGPIPQVNPFGKMSIFRLFELLVLLPKKAFFSFQYIVKDIFWSILPLKKGLEKWPFLDQNHGLNPLEKCQFFDFLNFLFSQPRKAFFRSRIS